MAAASSSSSAGADTIDNVKYKIQELTVRLAALRAEVSSTLAEKQKYEAVLRTMKADEATKKKKQKEAEKAEKQKAMELKKAEAAKKKEEKEFEKAMKQKATELKKAEVEEKKKQKEEETTEKQKAKEKEELSCFIGAVRRGRDSREAMRVYYEKLGEEKPYDECDDMTLEEEVAFKMEKEKEKKEKEAEKKKAEKEARDEQKKKDMERIKKADAMADEELEVFLTFMDDKKKKEETSTSCSSGGFNFKDLCFNPPPRADEEEADASEEEADASEKEEAEEEQEEAEKEEEAKPPLPPPESGEEEEEAEEEAAEASDEEQCVSEEASENEGDSKENTVFINVSTTASARSRDYPPFDVKVDEGMTWSDFRKAVYHHCHGKYDEPIPPFDSANMTVLNMVKNGKVIKRIGNSGEYGHPFNAWHVIGPFSIVFPLNKKDVGGGKRGRTPIGGNIVFNQQVYDDLARVPDTARAISTTVINEAMLKTFFTQLTDVQLSELIAVWNGKSVNKYKLEITMGMEPSIKFLDQQLCVLENLTDQFKARFGETFTADAVKEEMAVQIRLRELVALNGHGA